MNKIAVFPGSFDPITKGHCEIIDKALKIFDKIIVAVGCNTTKNYMFSLQNRVNFVKEHYKNNPQIEVETYNGLTVDFCKNKNAPFMLRGIRNPSDFEFEKAIAQTNRQIAPGIETVFLLSSADFSFISSSIVRELITNKGCVKNFVPESVLKML